MLKPVLTLIATTILLNIPWTVVVAADESSENVRLVTTGEILKVDTKNKTFEFRIVLDASFRRGGGYGGRNSGRRSGGMGGRGRFPGRFPGGLPGNGPYVPTLDIKVFTSEKTSLRVGGDSPDFSRLRPGERVTITAVHHGKGNDVDAIEVVATTGL